MSNLKQSFNAVRAALSGLDAAMAAALNAQTETHREELVELSAIYEKRIAKEVDDYNALKAKTDGALDLQEDVAAERKGVLDTSYLPAKMLFDKLAARWDNLSASEIEMLEEVLDGKVVRV
jgi:hypothetical protein